MLTNKQETFAKSLSSEKGYSIQILTASSGVVEHNVVINRQKRTIQSYVEIPSFYKIRGYQTTAIAFVL